MAEQSSSSASILLSALTGAAVGAAGLTWWLLSRAERRQAFGQQFKRLGLNGVQENGSVQPTSENLEQKVNRLNVAIEDVRRQLESMAPESGS
ncbi:MAG: hypothetical protein CBD29_01955 [Synechococcus sp. TMED169]|jgi:hypothetical protein|nr:MAG: hypothetical protein CBD29_01955 [Synechococcus sp. TMED169]